MSALPGVRSRIFVAPLVLAVALAVAAACGDDGGGGETPAAAETPAGGGETPTGLATQPERPATAQEVQEEVVEPSDGVIETSTGDNFWVENHFRVRAGEPFTIRISNGEQNPHDFAITGVDGQFDTDDDISTEIFSAGEEVSLDVTLDISGTYVFRCNVHPTEMWGEIDAVASDGGSAGY